MNRSFSWPVFLCALINNTPTIFQQCFKNVSKTFCSLKTICIFAIQNQTKMNRKSEIKAIKLSISLDGKHVKDIICDPDQKPAIISNNFLLSDDQLKSGMQIGIIEKSIVIWKKFGQ